jgi:hypothetical protein
LPRIEAANLSGELLAGRAQVTDSAITTVLSVLDGTARRAWAVGALEQLDQAQPGGRPVDGQRCADVWGAQHGRVVVGGELAGHAGSEKVGCVAIRLKLRTWAHIFRLIG